MFAPRLLLGLLGSLLLLPGAAHAELTLASCRTKAAATHPRLGAARALAAAASARRAIARAGYLPRLSAEGTYQAVQNGGAILGGGRTAPADPGGHFGPAELELFGATVGIQQTIWDFGRTTNAHEATFALERSARAEARAVAEEVDLAAEGAFRAALAAEELLLARKEAYERAKAHLEQASARVQLGLRPKYDLTRAQVEVATAELERIAAENAREQTREEVAVACAREPLTPEETLVPPPPTTSSALPPLEGLAAAALDERPEVRAARERAEAARQSVQAAWSLFLPSLGATGSVGYRGTAIDSMGPGWTALVQMTVPLFAGGADLGRVHEAQAQLSRAEAEREDVERRTKVGIRSAWRAAREAAARRVAATQLERAAQEGLLLAEGRYETGLGDALELADAQAALAAARSQRVQAGLDEALAGARLQTVLGKRKLP